MSSTSFIYARYPNSNEAVVFANVAALIEECFYETWAVDHAVEVTQESGKPDAYRTIDLDGLAEELAIQLAVEGRHNDSLRAPPNGWAS